jgi:hypothetical protein
VTLTGNVSEKDVNDMPPNSRSNTKALGRRKAPRLSDKFGEMLKILAQRKFGSLDCYYEEARKFYQKRTWKKDIKSIKRTFERAFNEGGPFGWHHQETYEHLVGIPQKIKKAIGYISLGDDDSMERSSTGLDTLSIVEQPEQMVILHSFDSIKKALLKIVQEARSLLSTTGSRSKNTDYFRAIEERLQNDKFFRYYRVLAGPPKTKELKVHLKRVVSIRDPEDHEDGRCTLCLGVADVESEPERLLVANETQTLIVLPSIHRLGDFDTALLIRDARYAERFNKYIHEYYLKSEQMLTKKKLLSYLKKPRWKK